MKNLFRSRNKKIIYTAIFGDRDDPKPIARYKGFDCVLFTENPEIKAENYQVIVCPLIDKDPVRNARFYKINSQYVLPDYDYSLWIDSNKSVSGDDLQSLFDKYLSDHDIALHCHPQRDCIYTEADVCIEKSKDNAEIIRNQMNNYRNEGYPVKNGLASTGIIFRRHTPQVELFNQLWWSEILNHSRRDQLSFNYVAWKSGIEFFTIPGHVRKKDVHGFRLFAHNKKSM